MSKMTASELEAFKRGRDDYHRGIELEDNPYWGHGLILPTCWRSGWIDGEREVDANLTTNHARMH
jgi:hypothetical protein